MSDEDVYRIILKFEGEEKAKSLAAAVALAEQKFQALYETLGRGDAQTKAAAAQLGNLQGQLEKAGGSSKQAGQLMNAVGYAADDLQYGFKGISNNIQPILMQIPALAALAGPISIAAIAAYQLYTHWDELAGLFGQGHVKSEAEEMDELAKATERTADQEERLQKLKERAKHVEAQGKEPEKVSDFKAAVDKAISNGPQDAINKGLDKHFGGRINAIAAQDPRNAELAELEKKLEAAKKEAAVANNLGARFGGEASRKLASDNLKAAWEARDDLRKSIKGDARKSFSADLSNDPETVKQLARAAQNNPRDFGQDGEKFAASLDAAADPDAKQRKKVGDAVVKFFDKLKEGVEKAAEKATKEMEKRADELAKPLQERFNLQAAGGKKPDEAEVRRQLERSGLSKEDAADSAGPVLKRLEAEWVEFLGKRSGEKGLTREDAAGDFLKEHSDKEGKKSRAQAEATRKKSVEHAEKATAGTGLDKRYEDAMIRSALAGGTKDEIQKRVESMMVEEFKAKGMGQMEAQTAAHAKSGEVLNKVSDEAVEGAMGPRKHQQEPEKLRDVQRIGVADFARSVEGSGHDDAQKKVADNTTLMKDYLAEMVRRGNGPAPLK